MERFGIQNQTTVLFLLVMFLLTCSNCFAFSQNDDVNEVSGTEQEWVRVGLVLDLGSVEGKIVGSSVSMALSDFYAVNSNYRTRIILSVRNSNGEPLLALASAVDLLQYEEVEAIIGGSSFLETKLLAELGEKARVPVISLNSPTSLSLRKYSHLIQATHDSSSEAKGITAFIHEFEWKSVALVYEDEDDWRESMHLLVDHFHDKGVSIQSKVGFTVSSREELMMERLRKLKDLGTNVFVVHLSEFVATHLFHCVGKLGMMSEGFAWILTARSMNSFIQNLDDFSKEAMEGVVGFKSYIPMSRELHNFTSRWRKSLPVEEAVGSEISRLSISGVWAHDVAWALARAAEVARMPNASSTLFEAITECRFKGLSGDFHIKHKKLLSNKFEILNLIGSGERRVGFWNSNGSFSTTRHLSSSTHNKLETIFWPGGTIQYPQGGKLGENKRKTLRVLVTSSNRFPKLVNVTTDPRTKKITADGFCLEVFKASISPFNYDLEFIRWTGGSNYDNLAHALSSQNDKYDAAVGDITITSNRSKYIDFTLPFTELGLGMVAPKHCSMWVFFQPLTLDLWMTSAAFFVLTGTIVWLIERPENNEFQGSWSQQIGVMLWFGFSTLVYAHREKLKHNLSRFVVMVWVFAVLILTTSYTATLTSMMTVQQIRFNSNKDFVGHLSGSLIANATLKSPEIKAMNTKGLNTSEDYAKALLNNTVTFIIDELPYLNVLLGEKPGRFLMVKPQVTTNGFGFMFQKGDELVHNVSREISELRTKGRLNEMAKRWFDNRFPYTIDDTPDPIDLYRFRGLFMITGGSSASTIFVVHLSQLVATHYLFPCAGTLSMMGEGFAWILTVKSMNSFHEADGFSKEAMEGVVGFRSYIPMSKELQNFTSRWRKSLPVEEAVGSEILRLSISGIWAHDVASALARASEVARMPNVSSTLLEAITQCRCKGLSGDFQTKDKKFLSDKFEIVNLIGSGERRVGFWNSNGTVDLLQTVRVEAIISGSSFLETKLLAEIGEQARVPVISLNSPTSLSLRKYGHLIQATRDSSSEAKGITAFIHGFEWKSVALVYEDDDDWRESMQLMVDHFHENGVHIQSKVGFTVSSSKKKMMNRLRKMKNLGTTIFVVHMSELVATHLFPCAGRLRMMGDGFAWILTAKTMNSFHGSNGDGFAKEAMEGVVGFRSYIPVSKELHNFASRWRKSQGKEEDVGSEITRLGISGVWAHDVACALARAVEFTRMPNVSSTLLEAIKECRFKGLSGDFCIKHKKLLSNNFEIVNLIGSGERRIGFWNSNCSFSTTRLLVSSTHNKLETIIWPGGTIQSPQGRKLGEIKRKTMRVLVTSSNRFPRLVKVATDPVTNEVTAEGFCIDVFRASIRPFNYEVEFILWRNGSNYDDLAYALSIQRDKYDAAVGDITITYNRSSYVDFTIPFTEMGLGIVAPKERSMWVFLQPLTPHLWMTSAAFFVLTGVIVWLIERPENKEFQGSWSKQIGVIFWFGFSTLVYAHREKLKHNLSRFVVTVWVFAVLILTTSYTATLTSMMTVQQIRFNFNKHHVNRVGHLLGSRMAMSVVPSPSHKEMSMKGLNTSEEYAQFLLNKSVTFVVDELPYLKVLLGENPAKFSMVKTQSTTNGFGFMFQKGDELVPKVSREISKLRAKGTLNEMARGWLEIQFPYTTEDTSSPITLDRFRGVFMITGVSSSFALAVLLIHWLRDRWERRLNSLSWLYPVNWFIVFLSQRLVNLRVLRTIHPSPLDDPISENVVQMTQSPLYHS
ncbi:hypothetical protein Bca52824_030016 [Brassica carinata]|uniref:Ionotropic glutamate receptor C-terminal domain-containing protein n=1 Tax=Brassica carinata TaxID=52824 RepID=A0A8X7V2T8_BRACI|nr:hypothetical protein Bca52824_030016 [Brassica carinata]